MKFTLSPFTSFLIATTAMITPHAFGQEAPAQPPAEEQPEQEASVIVVQGRFIPEPLQETSEVAAFLSDADLARAGDSDAAAALGRVTGLSVVEGKFVYVRGLGERYSSALLNGSPLPSPEPLQRVVPLDLFPSSVLSGVMVQKSYSAEFPGEFGGGVINLSTKGIPDENFLEIGISASANMETTLATGYTYDGGETDIFGFDNGVRKVPNQLREAWRAGQKIDASLDLYPAISNDAERQRIGQSFENAKLRLVQKNNSIPFNGADDISGGRVWDLNEGDLRLGVIGVLGYSNDWKTRDGIRQSAAISGGSIVAGDDYNFTSTTNEVGWDGLFVAGAEFGRHSVNFTNLLVRRTSKLAQQQFGTDFSNGDQLLEERTGWYERQLFSSQLAGKFDFSELTIDWRVASAQTSRDAPYEWQIGYVYNPTLNRFLTGNNRGTNETRFSELDDEVTSFGIDAKYAIAMDGVRDMEISGGIAHSDNSRDASSHSYVFLPTSALDIGQQQQRVDFLLSDFNIGPNPGQFQLTEVTGNIENAPAYESQLEVQGVYAKVDFEPILYVRTALGLRWEKAIESVGLIDFYGPDPKPNKIKKDYLLPAATLTWNFSDNQQFRLGASRTIGRPQFRELAPQPYYDSDTDRFLRGNPFLLDTIFKNFDSRYEWFFDNGQFFTLGAFYKDIQRPVDSIATAAGGQTTQTTFNAPAAQLLGAEIEVRKVFEDVLPSVPWFAGKNIFLQANYTYSTAEVKVDSNDQVLVQNGTLAKSDPATFYIADGSRLLGQSDHVANLQFGWEDEAAGSTGTFVATYVSERATTRAATTGGLKQPDYTEEPGILLDFVWKKSFEPYGAPVTLDVKVQNILNQDFEEVQSFESGTSGATGQVTINGYARGTTVSAGLSMRF